jgi:hypothetical protein
VAVDNAEEERRKIVGANDATAQRNLFLHLAKAKALSAEDIMAGNYLLFANEAGHRVYAHAIMTKTGSARITAHNYFVVAHMADSEAFLLANGELLASLPVPLFPPTEDFVALNVALMREYKEYVGCSGGAKRTSFVTKMHRPELVAEGGGSLPVVQDSTGQWCIDTTPIEKAFGEVYTTLNQLSADVKTLKEPGIAGTLTALVAKAKEQLGATRGYMRHATGTANGQRGRGRGGRGRGRGYPRGGAADPSLDF